MDTLSGVQNNSLYRQSSWSVEYIIWTFLVQCEVLDTLSGVKRFFYMDTLSEVRIIFYMDTLSGVKSFLCGHSQWSD